MTETMIRLLPCGADLYPRAIRGVCMSAGLHIRFLNQKTPISRVFFYDFKDATYNPTGLDLRLRRLYDVISVIITEAVATSNTQLHNGCSRFEVLHRKYE